MRKKYNAKNNNANQIKKEILELIIRTKERLRKRQGTNKVKMKIFLDSDFRERKA